MAAQPDGVRRRLKASAAKGEASLASGSPFREHGPQALARAIYYELPEGERNKARGAHVPLERRAQAPLKGPKPILKYLKGITNMKRILQTFIRRGRSGRAL